MERNIYRGCVYYVDLSPVKGSEQDGVRPVLVIQNNTGNKYSPTIIGAVITSRNKTSLPTHVEVAGQGLSASSIIMAEQLRTIDKCRLENYVTKLNSYTMRQVDKALSVSLDLGKGCCNCCNNKTSVG
ncbi:MAG: type II toxin-antitoxin system PemK/MazF family toxin [Defluviitaleaceae bacterium]|nr:type II toxin-antitoxin system PemK/MazF family toxin [Defluviitaleaceae bacterium]